MTIYRRSFGQLSQSATPADLVSVNEPAGSGTRPPLLVSNTCQYWTLLRLNAAGQARPQVMTQAQAFFQTQFADRPPTEASIQAQLLTVARSPDADRELAALCLRCYISHQISWACRRLVKDFGRFYHFDLADLLPYGLEDDGQLHPWRSASDTLASQPLGSETSASQPVNRETREPLTGTASRPQRCPAKRYEPLGLKVLRTFQPGSGSLSGWTSRLLKTQPELVSFLLEQGLYLISDWAILNDTLPGQLENVLTRFYQLSALAVAQARAILTVYRDIYWTDRQLQPTGLRCPVPTAGQLQRMAAQLTDQFGWTDSATQLLAKLQQIAQFLRQYRIYRKGGPFPAQLRQAHSSGLFDLPDRSSGVADETDSRLLESYQAAFEEAFDAALAAALLVHQGRFRSAQKCTQFHVALRLYHVQQLPMGEIAKRLGLRAQDAVVRLLRLKDLRAELRHQMRLQLQDSRLAAKIAGVAAELALCDRALNAPTVDLQQALIQLFEDHLETIIQTAQKEANTAVKLRKPSFFTRRLCAYLECCETVCCASA
jgi:hypothetical protein